MKNLSPQKIIIICLSAFVIGVILTAGILFRAAPSHMILEDKSPYGFEETIARFEEEVEAAGWSIVGYQDMQEVLNNHGHEVLDIRIFELCSARYSAVILAQDDERIVSPLMPCRVSIYKKSNGNTYITRLNSLLMARPFGGLINEVMQKAGSETEDIIAAVLQE